MNHVLLGRNGGPAQPCAVAPETEADLEKEPRGAVRPDLPSGDEAPFELTLGQAGDERQRGLGLVRFPDSHQLIVSGAVGTEHLDEFDSLVGNWKEHRATITRTALGVGDARPPDTP